MTLIAHPAFSDRPSARRWSTRRRLALLLCAGFCFGAVVSTAHATEPGGDARICAADPATPLVLPSTDRGLEYSVLWGRFQSPGYARADVEVIGTGIRLAIDAAPTAAPGERRVLWGMIRWSSRD